MQQLKIVSRALWSYSSTILECKWKYLYKCSCGESVIVAPYWNVNTIHDIRSSALELGYSSTILECKYFKVELGNKSTDCYSSTILECKFDNSLSIFKSL